MTLEENIKSHIPYNAVEEVTIPTPVDLGELIDNNKAGAKYSYWLRDTDNVSISDPRKAYIMAEDGCVDLDDIESLNDIKLMLKMKSDYLLNLMPAFYSIGGNEFIEINDHALLSQNLFSECFWSHNNNSYPGSNIEKEVLEIWNYIIKNKTYAIIFNDDSGNKTPLILFKLNKEQLEKSLKNHELLYQGYRIAIYNCYTGKYFEIK